MEDDIKQIHLRVTDDHRLDAAVLGDVFLQNPELHAHGVGVPDLGLGCYRNTKAVNRLVGRMPTPKKPFFRASRSSSSSTMY